MRIAILTTQCPFVVGGAELHARNLEQALRNAGHEAEIVTMPFKWYPPATVLDHMLAARALEVSDFNGVKIDLAIGLKFPAYLMRHPNKIFWILHQHRQAYDLWDQGEGDLFEDSDGQLVREAIRAADNAELGGATRIFANSANVASRLLRYNAIASTPLYHPPPLGERLRQGDFGDYFYYPSRLTPLKRQDFVLRSLALAHKSVRVVFSGAADNPNHGRALMALAHELGVEDRVEWRGFVSDDEMIELYAGARGVVFTPIDEDLGYVALEAMLAGKPLLTLADSGEPATLVRHGVEGLITAPQPEAFAAALDRLAASRDEASVLGGAGRERYRALGVSWANVVQTLTSASAAQAPPPPRPEKLQPLPIDPTDWLEAAPASAAPSLDELAKTYVFDAHLAQHRSYYETHWPRYRATLEALIRTGIKPRRILELGTSAPYVFTALLKTLFPDAAFTVVQESPSGVSWPHRIERKCGEGVDIQVFGLNAETTPLPFADGEFDLVVAMEVLEHFAIDPGFVFREAQRVLRTGGGLLVTTPNLVSLPALERALSGATPYSFGVFVPWHGVYGRHNREYTPLEVEALGRYAGFDSVLLETADVYQQNTAPSALVHYMREHNHPLHLRGQNIFYIGLKSAMGVFGPSPEALFPIDPAIFSGQIQLRQAGPADDHFIVQVTNHSPLTWFARGPQRVRLTLDRVDQAGLIALDVQSFDLPEDIEPGAALDIPIKVLRGDGVLGLWHEIGLYAEGAGAFKGAGRARTVALFAETIEPLPRLSAPHNAA